MRVAQRAAGPYVVVDHHAQLAASLEAQGGNRDTFAAKNAADGGEGPRTVRQPETELCTNRHGGIVN